MTALLVAGVLAVGTALLVPAPGRLSAAALSGLPLPGRPLADGGPGPGGPAVAGRITARTDEDRLHRTAPWWACGGGAGVYLLIGGVLGLMAGVTVAVALTRMIRAAELPSARRRREELAAALPAVVDLVAAGLAAGAAPDRAIDQVGRAWGGTVEEDLVVLGRRLVLGADPVEVWRDLSADPHWAPLGRALTRATESGASLAPALRDLAQDLRRTRRAEAEGRARSVSTRAAAPLGLCMLPAFVLVGVIPMIVAGLGAAGLTELFGGGR